MGCFNFECADCSWGENGTGEDGREYFDKPAAVVVKLKDGKKVIVHGRYTGYGEVETPSGHTFYHPQFEEFWDCWLDGGYNNHGEKGPFIAEAIYCEECLYGRNPTSFAEFDFDQMEKVVDYLEKKEAKEAVAAVAAAAVPTSAGPTPAVAAPTPAAPKKAPKPKPLTKEQLVAKVAELEAEVTRLKPFEERSKRLDTLYNEMHKKYTVVRRVLDSVKKAFQEEYYY